MVDVRGKVVVVVEAIVDEVDKEEVVEIEVVEIEVVEVVDVVVVLGVQNQTEKITMKKP